MGDIKVKSMRLSEEDIASFEKFAEENGFTQQQAFAALINLGELEKAKGILGERGKEIEAFQSTINKLLSFYVTSLDINATTEETVRTAMDKELALKDKIIAEQLKEYKSFKDINKKLTSDLTKSSEHINTLKEELNNSRNENIKLQDKINNYADMLSFYKEQLEKEEANLLSLKEEHKASKELTENRHKLELEAVSKRHDKELRELEERLLERKDLELSKKDLEIKELQGLVDKLREDSDKSS